MKVLLVKLGHLGDTVLLTPTLRLLRGRFPGAQIDVMVRSGCEVVLRGNPDVTRIIPVGSPEKENRSFLRELRESGAALRRIAIGRRYDYAFALSGSDRAIFWVAASRAAVRCFNDFPALSGWRRKIFTNSTGFDWTREHQVLRDFHTVAGVVDQHAQPGPLRFEPQVEEEVVREKLPWLRQSDALAVIHPTSRWAFKQWLPERWAAVADNLAARGLHVVFSCGPAARETELVRSTLAMAQARHHSTDGRLSLHELGWLLGRAQLFLGVDTVTMHLAAAMQVPTVALFGPSSEWSWHPWQCRHELVMGDCSCKAGRVFVCDKSKPYPCMARITVEAVGEAASRLLSRT